MGNYVTDVFYLSAKTSAHNYYDSTNEYIYDKNRQAVLKLE